MRREMRVLSVIFVVLLVGCDRTEQPPTGRSASVAASARSAAPGAEARCVFPMLSSPPSPAARAATCPPDNLLRPPSLPRGRVIFPEAPGRPEAEVELAIEPDEQTRGLMFRRELPPNGGMLFWGEYDKPRSFWM